MYQKVLAFEGFQIESAPDGREGIRKAKELKPDLIFCDIMMPKMNGIEVLDNLKADPETQHIPVIMLTNLSGTHDAETAIEKGAFAYMVKSEYKPKEVATKAKEFVGGLAQQQAQTQAQSVQQTAQPVSPTQTQATSQAVQAATASTPASQPTDATQQQVTPQPTQQSVTSQQDTSNN
jgi:CheY-like chemotaxis protein